jgi:hypothetical protein
MLKFIQYLFPIQWVGEFNPAFLFAKKIVALIKYKFYFLI